MGLRYRISYKKEAENRVADALSRRPQRDLESFAISMAQTAWILALADESARDETAISYCSVWLSTLLLRTSSLCAMVFTTRRDASGYLLLASCNNKLSLNFMLVL
jgi:hypothetical protein